MITEFKPSNRKYISWFPDPKGSYPVKYRNYDCSSVPYIASFYYRKMIKKFQFYIPFYKPIRAMIPKDMGDLPKQFVPATDLYYPIIIQLYHKKNIDFTETINRREIDQYVFIGKLSEDINNIDIMFFIYYSYSDCRARILINGKETILKKHLFTYDGGSVTLISEFPDQIVFTQKEKKYQNKIYNKETENLWSDIL